MTGRFRRTVGNRRDEAVAPAMLGLDELRGARSVPQDPANLRHAHLEGAIAHHGVTPHRREEGFVGDELSRVFEQILQHREGFQRQGKGLCAAPQTGIARVETDGTEAELAYWRHGSSPALI